MKQRTTSNKRYLFKFYCAYHTRECRGVRYERPEGIICEWAMLELIRDAEPNELTELRKYLNERIT